MKNDLLPLHRPRSSTNIAQLVLLGEEHSGRDEMNLAGHPFALLPSPGRCVNDEPIFYDWPRTLPNGKKLTASWRVGPLRAAAAGAAVAAAR